jgi:hypothetical protein
MFGFTKISDQGPSNPIIARIAIGLTEILKLTELTQEEKAKITFILYELSKDLVNAERSALKVIQEIEEIEASNLLQSFNQNFRSALTLDEVMTHIKYCKSGLRRVAQIIDLIAIKTDMKEAHFHVILKKMELDKEKFKDVLVEYKKILEVNRDWYLLIIDLRNDDEHREPTDDFLRNYHMLNGSLEKPQLIPMDNKQPIPVYEFLNKSIRCSLSFCEDLIVLFLLIHLPKYPRLELLEIPLSQRNIQCPKKFKIVPFGMQ